MDQKQIGLILLLFGVIFAIVILVLKINEDTYINHIVAETGSCYLSDGTCLHEDRNITMYIIGWAFSGVLFVTGLYFGFFDRTQEHLMHHQQTVSAALRKAKQEERRRDEFNAFLSAFSEQEKNAIRAIKEQDGILQSTLRYRTGMSKTSLSLLLKSLEERGVISREPYKKTNKIHLKKVF